VPAEEPAFTTIAIAGLGLIGGSIALAVRERWPSIRIVGVDHPAVLAHGRGSGAIDRAAASLAEIGSPDLVVLAAPVAQNIELLRQLAANPNLARPSTIVTDVGGTKRDIVGVSRSLRLSFSFVGGHPIGGAERGGFGFARPDLFAGRPWILTPVAESDPAAVTAVEQFARGLGARPAVLDAADHDRLMAYVSHLPQLTASALMSAVGRGAPDGLRLAGRGLVDTTRLASSPASVWTGIAANNSDFVAEALDVLIATLTELRSDLQKGEALEKTFHDAGRWRTELMKGRD
jgi:prephenate dehydrogenase